MAVEYISDIDHYCKVLERVTSVRKSLWIGTADIKDLYVKTGEAFVPFLKVLSSSVLTPSSDFILLASQSEFYGGWI